MSCFKKNAYALFILLLHTVSASATPDMKYDTANKDYSLLSEVTPKLSWEKNESQSDKSQYCLTPSDPGCSNMWHKEKKKGYDEQIQRYHQKKLYQLIAHVVDAQWNVEPLQGERHGFAVPVLCTDGAPLYTLHHVYSPPL